MHKDKIKFTWVQLLWAVSGAVLLAAALLSLFDGHEDLTSIAQPLGLAMLYTGLTNIVIHIRKRHVLHGSHWILADGMSSALLSVFLLFNQMIEAALIPFFFGFWELFSGILKVIDAGELREERIRGWQAFAAVGTVEILSGIAALLKPVDDFVGMHGVVALVLLIQATGYLFKIGMYTHLTNAERKCDVEHLQ